MRKEEIIGKEMRMGNGEERREKMEEKLEGKRGK